MELTFLLGLLTCSTMAEITQKHFSTYVILKDKNITEAVIWTTDDARKTECASVCVHSDSCVSFFYNTVTSDCQCHDRIFTTSIGATDQTGLIYYSSKSSAGWTWCPQEIGFAMLSEDGPCVKYHTDAKTWYDANQTCPALYPGSRLVVLDTQLKSSVVRAAGMAINDQFMHGVWIGLLEYSDGQYMWVNGGNVTFTDWSVRDWSNPTADDCGFLYRNEEWKWMRFQCGYAAHYICEMVKD